MVTSSFFISLLAAPLHSLFPVHATMQRTTSCIFSSSLSHAQRITLLLYDTSSHSIMQNNCNITLLNLPLNLYSIILFFQLHEGAVALFPPFLLHAHCRWTAPLPLSYATIVSPSCRNNHSTPPLIAFVTPLFHALLCQLHYSIACMHITTAISPSCLSHTGGSLSFSYK